MLSIYPLLFQDLGVFIGSPAGYKEVYITSEGRKTIFSLIAELQTWKSLSKRGLLAICLFPKWELS